MKIYKSWPLLDQEVKVSNSVVVYIVLIGSLGTVFSGIYRDQKVAVKKVNEPKQTDIWQLRKLDHQNIIKFLYVPLSYPLLSSLIHFTSIY